MKILKVRRGYTTNSSAASEFIPPHLQPGYVPAQVPTNPGAAAQPGAAPVPAPLPSTPPAPAPAANAAPAPSPAMKPAAPKPVPIPVRVAPPAQAPAPGNLSVPASPSSPTATATTVPEATTALTTQAGPIAAAQAPAPAQGWSNSALLGVFAALVAAAFLGERLVRRLFRSMKRRDELE